VDDGPGPLPEVLLAAGLIVCGLCGTEFAPECAEDEVNGAGGEDG
jgi:hypothetical protein